MRLTYFADILLPLPLEATFTYRVPQDLEGKVEFGVRVIVPFGRSKLYSGLVTRVHTEAPKALATKYILDVMDERPVVSARQFQLWQWMADYYMCSLGEVMASALPSALRLASETKIKLHPDFSGDVSMLNEYELRIVESLVHKDRMTVAEVAKSAQVQKILPIIKSLVDKRVVVTDEEIRNPYKPKRETYIRLAQEFTEEETFMALLDRLNGSARTAPQADLLLSFMMLTRREGKYDFMAAVPRSELLQAREVSPARLQTLLKKGILVSEEVVTSRLVDISAHDEVESIQLTEAQQTCFEQIHEQFARYPVTLLHGVTGSGKTEIYIKLIDEVLQQGRQVLYLLPEIALTTQIVNRLRHYFGDKVGVYHSRFNEYERVEIWNRVLEQGSGVTQKYQLILGARSALLLPFQNLGLIIVDEEHDTSYKQQDPAPRYHARSVALMMARDAGAQVLMGTATPAIETYYNAMAGKYRLVEMTERYAGLSMPEITMVDLKRQYHRKEMYEHFADPLVDRIREQLAHGKQIIIFQNRRGYAPYISCRKCGYVPKCCNCDVSLTYHKRTNSLVCHYCGYSISAPAACPSCSGEWRDYGMGTEKIEDEVARLFPDARVARMDLDTTRNKNSHQRLINAFARHEVDILIGTQMVTKGLHFNDVSLVAVLNADSMMQSPDFRSYERAFQMLEQVAGRAGRTGSRGEVVVQTFQPDNPLYVYLQNHDYQGFYAAQLKERRAFRFPPFYRLIVLTLKHRDYSRLDTASRELYERLHAAFGVRCSAVIVPPIARVQNMHLRTIRLRIEVNASFAQAKKIVMQSIAYIRTLPNCKGTIIQPDVDPMG